MAKSQKKSKLARVAIIMGSATDAPRMKAAADVLSDFGIPYLQKVVSAVGSSRVDLQACKLEYSIVSPK